MVLGLLSDTQTPDNLRRRPDCVAKVPSPDLWEAVERLAPLTGKNPVPSEKSAKFRFELDKFVAAALTPLASESVNAPRVKECPVQLEATVSRIHMLQGEPRLDKLGGGAAVEVRMLKAHVRGDFILRENYVNPEKWQPLIYNFPTTLAAEPTVRRSGQRFDVAGSCRNDGPCLQAQEVTLR
jgi:flavin reductase (DIM6/NTAB) family NADH-FMN oxidoreductase RutF